MCNVRVGENLIDVTKVECGSVLRLLTVRPEVLDGNSKEGSDSGRE